MKQAKTLAFPHPPRHKRRAHWALLLFLALALGAATAGLLNQQPRRPEGPEDQPGAALPALPGPYAPSSTATSAAATATGTPTSTTSPTGAATTSASPGAVVRTDVVLLPPDAGDPTPSPRPSSAPSTAAPTRTPTPTRSPSPTASPAPVVANPRVSAVPTGTSYRSGAFVRGKVVVSGLPAGYSDDATLRLYGPFSTRADVACEAGRTARTDMVRVSSDGTWSGPAQAITRRGFYVWSATLPAGPASTAASSGCDGTRFEVTR